MFPSAIPGSIRAGRRTRARRKAEGALFEPIEKGIRGVDGPENELFKEAQPKVQKELQLFRYLYKDSAYDHEKEYRLVILDPKGVIESESTYEQITNTRGETVFRHYMTHASLYSEQILGVGSQVILGPSVPHAENARRTIDELCIGKVYRERKSRPPK